MIEKVTMLKFVLFDANVIIEAYKLGVWEKLLDKISVLVPSIVAHDEALFFEKEKEKVRKAIDLKRLIRMTKIKEVSATSAEMEFLHSIFDRVFVQELHEGELEALALIKANKVGEALFCTGDAVPIRALAMIGHSEVGISMETLLKKTGLQKTLDKQFTEQFFRENLLMGKQNRITRKGLK